MILKDKWKIRVLVLVLVLTWLVFVCALLYENLTVAGATQYSELYNKLSQIEGVHDIETVSSEKFKEKYLFNISLPLDWNNQDGEHFDERVVLSFNDFDKYNVIETEGYKLSDSIKAKDRMNEFAEHYCSNQIKT